MTDGRNILETRGLRVNRGGSLLLDIASLIIEQGETLCLIGPNGAGKSTLLMALSFLIKPSQGDIIFKGETIIGKDCDVLEYRRKLAVVFQEPLLFNTTVFNNAASGLKIRGVNGADIRHAVEEQLERFGIGHLRDRSARTLSGGEAQRTSLARAFAIHPEILFLDEPFAALDPPTRESIIVDLKRALGETKTTTVMATHDRMEALRLSDRIAVMNGGRIAQIGHSADIMNRPADEFVASFVGTETILEGKVIERNGGTILASVSGRTIQAVGTFAPGSNVILCIRPEHVTLLTNTAGRATSARNVFRGRIEKIIPMGLFQKVELDCGFPLVAYVTDQSLENLILKEGQDVDASFKATAVHVIGRCHN
jgi:tungstate transport system ATP-binding protein